MSIHKRVVGLVIMALFVTLPDIALSEQAKLQDLKEIEATSPTLKNLDSSNKKLADKYKELMIKEGYISPDALNCSTTCTVSCTWVGGKCEPTTSCSVTCQ